MRFPYAAKGVSKIFTAEIILLFSGIFGTIAMVLSMMANTGVLVKSTSDVFYVITGALLIVTAVLFVIGGIINIIGYFQAAKDEEGFRKAILCEIFSLFFAFGYQIFVNQTGFLGWLATFLNFISLVLGMFVAFYMIGGLTNLSAKCNRPDMVANGAFILKLLVTLYIISFIVTFIVRYFKENAFNQTIVSLLTILAAVLSVILYFCELVYIAKSSRMLKEEN